MSQINALDAALGELLSRLQRDLEHGVVEVAAPEVLKEVELLVAGATVFAGSVMKMYESNRVVWMAIGAKRRDNQLLSLAVSLFRLFMLVGSSSRAGL